MGTEETATNESGTALPIGGLVCILFAIGLFLGAGCWLGVLILMESFRESSIAMPRIAYIAGLFQVFVSILLGVSGALYIRKSRRAKVLLVIAVACLIVELPLVILAFAGLVASNS